MIYSARIGQYRHRISIEYKETAQDSETGEQTYIWQTLPGFESVPARFLTGQGGESDAADTKTGRSSARIAFRWQPGITEEMRVNHNGVFYDIKSIDYDSTGRREIRIVGQTGMTDGS